MKSLFLANPLCTYSSARILGTSIIIEQQSPEHDSSLVQSGPLMDLLINELNSLITFQKPWLLILFKLRI